MRLAYGPLGPTLVASLVILLACLLPASALQQDLAGKVDWHKALIGTPRIYPSIAAPRIDSNDLVVAITEKNVFAGVSLSTGEIAWRHQFDESDPLGSFYTRGDDTLLISGPGGKTVRMFETNGTLRWEHNVHEDVSRPGEPGWVGTAATYHDDWVVVLSGGRKITKFAVATGVAAWTWDFPPSNNVFTDVAVDNGKVIVMGYTSQFTASAVSMVLDFDNVTPFSDIGVVPSHTKFERTFLVRRADGKGHAVVWAEFGRIRVAALKTDGTVGENIDALPGGEGRRYQRIIDVGTCRDGYVVAELEDGAAGIVEINDQATMLGFFAESEGTNAPVYAASFGDEKMFSRVAYKPSTQRWVQSVYTITDGAASTRVTTAEDLPQDEVNLYSVMKGDNLVFVTATGAVQAYDFSSQNVLWTRHEALSDLADVHFVDLGEAETKEALEVMEEESFGGRLARHIAELRFLPSYVVSKIASISKINAILPTKELTAAEELAALQKIVVAVTRNGQAFGINPANGRTLWTSNLGFFSQDGPELEVHYVFTTRNNTEPGNPQVAVLASRTRDQRTVTLGYHIDAMTGEVAGNKVEGFNIPAGKEVIEGRPKTAFLTPFINCCTRNRVIAVVDEDDKLVIFPKCKKVANALQELAPRMFYSTVDREVEGTFLRGYAPDKLGDGMVFSTVQLWKRCFPAQVVLDVSPLTPSSTASFGRALGDKSVLYKYLNPHLEVVTTVSPLKNIGAVYVIDTTTGATVYEAEIPYVVGNNLRAVMVENWLVYAWLENSPTSTEGWRLASVELYESDDREASVGRSSLASTPSIDAISQTFILSGSIRTLAFSTSKFGVTIKDILYINDLGQVVMLPRRLLDPRRPTGKPSKADQEEMLIPYSPVLPHNPHAVVSHKYPVLGLKALTSAPTLLESTSLLLASGVDLFCTAAIQPSGTFDILGEGFNKLQLLLTLAALAVGVAVARPAVQRKSLKEKWF